MRVFSFSRLLMALSIAVMLVPSITLADTSNPDPTLNPLCWTEQECVNARLTSPVNPAKDPATAKAGFISSVSGDICFGKGGPEGKDDLGKCLPVGKTITEISFGGNKTFYNIGDFMVQMYDYGLTVAGILAIIMIVVAGIEWVSSGGNSETISSAKTRITGAIVGLIIAYLSYFILQTINPDLVSLRLPQVWMVKQQGLVKEFCTDMPTSTKFSIAGVQGQLGGDAEKGKKFEEVKKSPDTFLCGQPFFMSNQGGSVCYGGKCNENQMCLNFDSATYANDSLVQTKKTADGKLANNYNCIDGKIGGRIFGDVGGVSQQQIQPGSTEDTMRLVALCKDGTIKEVAGTDPVNRSGKNHYVIKFAPGKLDVCGSATGEIKVAGYYLVAELNDESGGAAPLTGNGGKGSFGLDDWYAIGRVPGSRVCNINLGKISEPSCGSGSATCSCFAVGRHSEDNAKNVFFQNYLISSSELTAGFQCDLVLNTSEFPPLSTVTNFGTCMYSQSEIKDMENGPAWSESQPWHLAQSVVQCLTMSRYTI